MKFLLHCPIEMFYIRHTFLQDHKMALVSVIMETETRPPEKLEMSNIRLKPILRTMLVSFVTYETNFNMILDIVIPMIVDFSQSL